MKYRDLVPNLFFEFGGKLIKQLIVKGDIMSDVKLHPMKELKIIIEGEHVHFITGVLDRIKASGYTVFNNLSGKGHHGYHEGHLLFNDTSSLQMVLTVVPEEKLNPILSGIKPVLGRHSGNLFVLDVSVLRPDHFEK